MWLFQYSTHVKIYCGLRLEEAVLLKCHTTPDKLQIQWDSYQITKGIFV